MRVRIFGPQLFESRWVPRPRGWLCHKFFCDGQVAVHDTWLDQGYVHAVVYDHKSLLRGMVLDWCQQQAPSAHLLHPSGAILFRDAAQPRLFKELLHD